MKKWLALVLFSGLTAYAVWLWWPSAAGGKGGGRERPPVPVVVAAVTRQELGSQLQALGTAEAREGVVITAQQTGIVEHLHFRDGDNVNKDALLLTLHDDEEQARVREARAKLDDAHRQLDRLNSLGSDKAVSRSSIEDKESSVRIAEAQVAVAQAALDKRYIRAPFSGVLGARRVSPGALVTPGTVITTLDDISVMRVQFSVPEMAAVQLQKNMDVSARSAAFSEQLFTGKLTHIDTRINPLNRSIEARAELNNPHRKIKPGMLLELQLTQASQQVLSVPENGLISVAEKQFVWKMQEDGSVHQTQIQTGKRRIGWVEVISGLNEGDQIVVEGVHKLREGQKVSATAEATNTATNGK